MTSKRDEDRAIRDLVDAFFVPIYYLTGAGFYTFAGWSGVILLSVASFLFFGFRVGWFMWRVKQELSQ